MHIVMAALFAATLPLGTLRAEMGGDPLRFMATCVGRLSAEVFHQRILHDPSASQTDALRTAMIEILASLTPDGQGAQVLNMRIEANAAHSALLTRGTYRGEDWASERAAAEIAFCASFVVFEPPELAASTAPMQPTSVQPVRLGAQ
jgi:hypothetical protein